MVHTLLRQCRALIDTGSARFAWRLTALDTLLILGCLALALAAGLPVDWGFGERKPITVASFLQLLLIAAIAREIRRERLPGKGAGLWRALAFLFVLLAVDDLFRLHESIDHLICRWCGFDPSGPADYIDDGLIVLYGVIGVCMLAAYWREALILRAAPKVFIAAISCAFCMVVVDAIGNDDFLLSRLPSFAGRDGLEVVEESLKIYAEACFAASFAAALRRLRMHGVSPWENETAFGAPPATRCGTDTDLGHCERMPVPANGNEHYIT